MNQIRVFSEHQSLPIQKDKGITSQPYTSSIDEITSLSNGITSLEPGAAVPFHIHNVDECIVVIEGNLVAEGNEQRYALHPFDGLFVPAGVIHRFANESQRRGRILWTYPSKTVTRTFISTGTTVPYLASYDSPADPH